ncbi:uncharacterized protein RCC_11303 [Ramularia collo-cygni]|uniref:F-box domain-containing protein n=1 Tax=Ramularia collo-cygni TaxID=112498 RepID=A0A2D3VEK1_9PEZI|nr:uncharacterized protein RCC_11303 [Ramularia collo-cygni]CZT25635.1 uncharacterized protein RCC_11303 [Ramularia collo-cygni]
MNKLFSRRSSKNEPQPGVGNGATLSTSFFSLPAELRNTIYTLAAQDLPLTIVRHSPGLPRSIPGLLLASRRCRMEFLPILLSCCAMTVKVADCNFSNVLRVIGGLYSRELKALRMNKNITIVLDASGRSTERELRTNLRSWVKHKARNLDQLPWRYRAEACVPECGRTLECGHARLLVVLREGARSNEEALAWEVRIMLEGIDDTWSDRINPVISSKMDRFLKTGSRIRRAGSK